MTDSEILELINKRDEAALREIERQYSARCQDAAKEITGSEEAARECFFDAMISLWNGGNISSAAEGGQVYHSESIGEYLEREVRIAAEKRAGNKAKTSAETEGVAIVPPAAAVFQTVSGVSDISGTPDRSEALAARSENGAQTQADPGENANADAADISGISGISGTGKKKKTKALVITGIIAAVVIAVALIALASRMNRSHGDENEPDIVARNSPTPEVSTPSTRPTADRFDPFENGVPILSNDNAMLPEILSDYVKSYEPLVFSSTYMENKIMTDTGDLSLTFWEAYQGVSYAREDPCGGVLILDNYNFDPTEKTGFSFTTQMSGNIAIRAGAWIPVSFMAQYSGTAEIRTDGQQIIACTVDKIEPVPFDSINTFLALNPNLPDSILASLEKTGIEELNSYIKDLFDTLSETESKGDKYGNLYHSTQVWFKWNRGKTALWVYKNCTRSLNTYSEITYDHSGDSLNSVTVYNQDMSSVIYKTSETATGAESGGELGWYDADPDEPDFYVHTFGADNCRTIYTFNNLRLSRIELRTGQIETNNSTSIATVTYTFYKGFTPSGNSLIRSSSYGYRKVFLQFEPGGNICSREVYEHDRHIESFLISKGYSDPDGDLTYAEQRTFNDGSYINRVYHTTGYKDKVLVLESESTSNPDGYSSTIYYDCAGNVIVTYNYQADLLDELKYAYFEPGGNNSSASVLLFGNVYAENSASWITALNTGRGLQSRRIPDKLLLLDDGHFELYMTETVSLPVPATASSSFLVSVQTKYTGSILESIPEDSLYYHLRFERCEVTGLRATSYEELYDHYNGINDGSVFFDEFGKMLVGCKDEAEFEGLMREYLEMMAGPDDVTGEAMSDIFILKGNYVETALSLITCYIDPPPEVIPITDPIVIDD